MNTEETSEASIKVFPNPSSEKITVQWGTEAFEKIEIIDIQGKLIYEQPIPKGNQQLELILSLADKIFFARLSQGNKVIVKKIVVQK